MKANRHTVYRIWYGDIIVYVGRTNQPLSSRIRGHVLAKPMHRTIDINQITKIDYHEFNSEADMNLYEIYLILKLKPVLNVDDKCKDLLTVTLPEIGFTDSSLPRSVTFQKWKQQIEKLEHDASVSRAYVNNLHEQLSILRSSYRLGDISEEEFEKKRDDLKEQIEKEIERRNSILF